MSGLLEGMNRLSVLPNFAFTVFAGASGTIRRSLRDVGCVKGVHRRTAGEHLTLLRERY